MPARFPCLPALCPQRWPGNTTAPRRGAEPNGTRTQPMSALQKHEPAPGPPPPHRPGQGSECEPGHPATLLQAERARPPPGCAQPGPRCGWGDAPGSESGRGARDRGGPGTSREGLGRNLRRPGARGSGTRPGTGGREVLKRGETRGGERGGGGERPPAAGTAAHQEDRGATPEPPRCPPRSDSSASPPPLTM